MSPGTAAALASASVVAAAAAVGSALRSGARWRARRRASRLGSVRHAASAGSGVGTAGRWASVPEGRLGRCLARVSAGSLGPSPTAWVRRLLGSRRVDAVLPELLVVVARELRSGASLATAVTVAAESVEDRAPGLDPGLGPLATSLRRGTGLVEAVGRWAGTGPSPSRRLAATALVLAAETGGTTAVVVDGVAETLRDRVALEREVGALSSQARASAVVLVVAPVVVATLAASADPAVADVLLRSPLGWGCIVGGLALDAVGAAWMHVTIRRAT